MSKKPFFKVYDILIVSKTNGIKRFSAEFQMNYFDRFQKILKKYHKKAYAICLCSGKENQEKRKLAIKYLESTRTFYLARYPNTAQYHAPDCIYSLSAQQVVTPQERKKEIPLKGFLNLRLAKTLAPGKNRPKVEKTTTIEERLRRKIKSAQNNLEPRKCKPQVTLLGLLHIIWERSKLNLWFPSKDSSLNFKNAMEAIKKASGTMKVSVYNLSEVLVISSFSHSHYEFNKKNLEFAVKNNARVVFIGLLRKCPFSKTTNIESGDKSTKKGEIETVLKTSFTLGSSLPILDYSGVYKVTLTEEAISLLLKRFKKELSCWFDGVLTVCICVGNVKSNQTAKSSSAYIIEPVDIALMCVSQRFIPISSKYELLVEEKLREEKRVFKKPVVFHPNAKILPNFVLYDTEDRTYLEIFDFTGKNRQKKLEEKIEVYRKKNKKLWLWDPLKTEKIPSFPPASSQDQSFF